MGALSMRDACRLCSFDANRSRKPLIPCPHAERAQAHRLAPRISRRLRGKSHSFRSDRKDRNPAAVTAGARIEWKT
eukprot:8232579-Alexandrium_andersonii.AAC.1